MNHVVFRNFHLILSNQVFIFSFYDYDVSDFKASSGKSCIIELFLKNTSAALIVPLLDILNFYSDGIYGFDFHFLVIHH